jgi:Schlafen, AlbA_2
MWAPRTWKDIEQAIGVVSESDSIDFKKENGRNPAEIAKDVCALTLNGGVIIYGIDETPEGLARAITPVPLADQKERIQQVVDTRIAPPVSIAVDYVRQQSSDSEGVVVVSVQPSTTAPHYANSRYYVRRGTTTGYLTEREIAQLYEQRSQLQADVDHIPHLDGYIAPSGGLNPGSGYGGLGVLHLVVATSRRRGVEAGADVRLQRALSEAVRDAVDRLEPLVHATRGVATTDELLNWRPPGDGRVGGRQRDGLPRHRRTLRLRRCHIPLQRLVFVPSHDETRRGRRWSQSSRASMGKRADGGTRHRRSVLQHGGVDFERSM